MTTTTTTITETGAPRAADAGAGGSTTMPLTAMQAGMLFQARLQPGAGYDIEQLTMDLDEELDVDRFVQAFQHVVDRHPMLRTRFRFEGVDEPLQETLASWCIPVVIEDWGPRPTGGDAAVAWDERRRAFLDADRRRGFVLDEAPPQRLLVARAGPDRAFVCWTFHHILLDGRSFIVVLRDVFAAYRALRAGQAPGLVLPPPPPPFSAFVAWTRRQRFATSLPFWRSLLLGKDAPTPLPPLTPARKVEPGTAVSYGELSRFVDPRTTVALRALAQATGTTLGTVVQGAWALTLNRLTGDDDVVFGTTRACRRSAFAGDDPALDASDMVGLFINTLPVRARIVDDEPVAQFLAGLRQQSLDVRAHEHTPLVDVLGQSDVPRGTPLFHTLLMFENQELNASLRALDADFAHRRFHYEEQPTFPLNVTVFDHGGPASAQRTDGPGDRDDRLELRVLFDRTRFADAGIERLMGWIENVLSSMTTAKTTGQVLLLPDDERTEILFRRNVTARPFPDQTLLHELFEARVDEHRAAGSDAVAVVCSEGLRGAREEESITFLGLEERANRLAWHLRAAGAVPGTYVGILLDRSVDLVVALLAVAKSGAAYVPLDPEYPEERLAFMIEDTAAPVVITQQKLVRLLPAGCATVVVDEERTVASLSATRSDRPPRVARPVDVCYTIFTSGSTGKPKGVVLTHEAVINTLDWVNREFGFSPSDRLLFVTSVCFDLSVFDVFGTLGIGASLRVATAAELRDPEALVARLTSGEITVWDSAPAALARLVSFFPGAPTTGEDERKRHRLRLVMLSGDWIPVALPGQLRATFSPNLQIKSLGGATEAAIWSNYYNIQYVDPNWVSIPYGAPIQNAYYHVLDRRLHPVPPGVTGDLYIGGTCLAVGYLKRPELTAERFLQDPFVEEAKRKKFARPAHQAGSPEYAADRLGGHGPTLYKTGDLARYYDDDGPLAGQLEFLGRADFQVKIRGFRVELGEVDAVIGKLPGVKDVVCAARVDPSGQKVLVAYVVPNKGEDGANVTAQTVKDHVGSKLPDFMVPTHVVLLPDGLPLSVNGKVDRKALPDPLTATARAAQKGPSTEMERKLLPLWREVLGTEHLGVDDNFFDKGGHSLLATLLVSRIKQRLGLNVPLSRLFSANTVEKLARTLEEDARAAAQRATAATNATSAAVRPELSSLIVLNDAGSRTPTFFIAGIGGHVFTFQKLAALLGADTPTYGFRAIGGESGEIPKESVEEIAAAYLDELDARGLAKAPIVLCGYSFGGYVAYELALRLEQRGVPPALLVFFDVLAPGYPRRLPVQQRALLHAREFLKRDLAGKRTYVQERLGNVRRRVYMKLGLAERLAGDADVGAGVFDEARQQEMRALWGALALAQVQYRPRRTTTIPGLLFKAAKSFDWPATKFDDPAHGWRDWLKGELSVIEVEGAHLQLFEGKNPETMARALARFSPAP